MRGSPVLLDFYKNNEKYEEVVDKDGFLHTGDVGMILPNGSLKIIDRAKNIFKLS
jgi:long-chain acyl-CoA synthetase